MSMAAINLSSVIIGIKCQSRSYLCRQKKKFQSQTFDVEFVLKLLCPKVLNKNWSFIHWGYPYIGDVQPYWLRHRHLRKIDWLMTCTANIVFLVCTGCDCQKNALWRGSVSSGHITKFEQSRISFKISMGYTCLYFLQCDKLNKILPFGLLFTWPIFAQSSGFHTWFVVDVLWFQMGFDADVLDFQIKFNVDILIFLGALFKSWALF
jgi:hypothetical protein